MLGLDNHSVHGAPDSFLSTRRIVPDSSVTLEIFFVRCPYGDETLNRDFWKDVDEQNISPELRRELSENGLRMGVVGTSIPSSLAEILDLGDKECKMPDNPMTTLTGEELTQKPKLLKKTVYVIPDQRNEILTSSVTPEVTILLKEHGVPCGESYKDAQGVIVTRMKHLPDGRISLEVTPELHYGQVRQRYSREAGALRMDAWRPRHVYEMLRTDLPLAPGEMLAISSYDSRPCSLGSFFLSEESETPAQRLLLVRFAHAQSSEVFNRSGKLPLDTADME